MILHRLANTLLKALMPLSAIRQAQAFGWDHEEKWLKDESWLADVEADHDAWEADELWAAHRSEPGPCPLDFTGDSFPPEKVPPAPVMSTTPPPVGGAPTGDVASAGRVSGGALKSDEQIIHELVEDYREFLRQCFGK